MILVSKNNKTNNTNNKKDVFGNVIHKSTKFLFPKANSPLIKSMSMPMVNEVVLAADLKCSNCQQRVANVISAITDLDSIVFHVTEKKVTLTRKSSSEKGPKKCPIYNRISQLSS